MFVWWRDVLRESRPRYGLFFARIGGYVLFALFWASSPFFFCTTVEDRILGNPFLNTTILLSSEAAVAGSSILSRKGKAVVYGLVATISWLEVFSGFQGNGILLSSPSIIWIVFMVLPFFLASAFHDFHVIIGIEEIMADHVHQEMTQNWMQMFSCLSVSCLKQIEEPNGSDSSLSAQRG
ncbi:hypothetical protein Leryth_022980 [Lithospermum erythrorhizon]|nr:hypothetical protein Leryth_022980 [Lithospermum erythrorhizon]